MHLQCLEYELRQIRPFFSVLYAVGERTDVIDLAHLIYYFRKQCLSYIPSQVARKNLMIMNTINDSDVWFSFTSKELSNIDTIKEIYLTLFENPFIR